MRPSVFSSHAPALYAPTSTAASPHFTSTTAFAETRSFHERLRLPGTSGLHLVRSSSPSSSPAPGSLSTLTVRLTPPADSSSPVLPASLRRVLLSVRVAGRVFRRAFEADPGLEFVYGWDRRNAYDQKVHGVVRARVSVGYVYRSCPSSPVWVTRTARMVGFGVDASAVGEGWNLDVHHHYNAEQGKA